MYKQMAPEVEQKDVAVSRPRSGKGFSGALSTYSGSRTQIVEFGALRSFSSAPSFY